MAKWQLVKLDFQGNPVHFGEVGIGLEAITERIHSDTLFSAWVSAYAKLYPELINELLDKFPYTENHHQLIAPPFQISSTLVYGHPENPQKKTSECIYYLPTLLQPPRNYPINDLKLAKIFRNLKFVPRSIWQRWYQGQGFDVADEDELLTKPEARQGKLTEAGTFCYSEMFKNQTLPKVSVDRIHHGTNFYHTSFTYFPANFPEQAGIYFLFKMSEPDPILLQQLQSALKLLGDEGIGGERSSGAGRFQATWHDLSPTWRSITQEFTTHNSHALISLFWDDPKICADLVANSNTRYQLQERGGWISAQSGRQLRRKNVQMFTEGSVFLQPPQGQLAIVTPQELNRKKHHPIYRSGISLSLPVTLQLP